MNLSMKWLKEFVDIDIKPRDFSEAMTISGSKVEGYEIEGSEISNVVVGKILSIVPHQDSDHLVICQVDIGEFNSRRFGACRTEQFHFARRHKNQKRKITRCRK